MQAECRKTDGMASVSAGPGLPVRDCRGGLLFGLDFATFKPHFVKILP